MFLDLDLRRILYNFFSFLMEILYMLTMQGPFIQPWPYWFSLFRIREAEKVKYSVRTHKQAILISSSTFEFEYAMQILSNKYI